MPSQRPQIDAVDFHEASLVGFAGAGLVFVAGVGYAAACWLEWVPSQTIIVSFAITLALMITAVVVALSIRLHIGVSIQQRLVRVERSYFGLQWRLVTEFRFDGIRSIDFTEDADRRMTATVHRTDGSKLLIMSTEGVSSFQRIEEVLDGESSLKREPDQDW